MSFARLAGWALPVSLSLGCAPIVDSVFIPLALEPSGPHQVPEGFGTVVVPLRLSDAPSEPVTLGYRVLGLEAQNDCPEPDFEAPEGRVEWPVGVRDAMLRIYVDEDDLAETDERFQIVFDVVAGLPAAALAPIEIVILDNDRSGLIDARAHGVVPGAGADQAAALEAALAASAALGRGVLVMAPGDYEISSALLPAGVTLSARGVRWHRPPMSAADLVTLRIEHSGAEDSALSLAEGLSIDGRRDEQGPYRDHERESAHLVALRGDASDGGRVRSTLERLQLLSGTGSGVMVATDSDVTVCDLAASELWRDAVTVVGGNSVVRLRNIDATASEGTGLWLGARDQGFQESLTIDVEADNVSVSAGDVEIETAGDSRVTVRGLVMTQPPFRLDAPGGSVRISDSVLMVGLASELHDYLGSPYDVLIESSNIVVSEVSDDPAILDQARSFAALSLRSETMASGEPAPGVGSLVLDACRFEIGREVDADDSVFALDNPGSNAAVIVRGSELGAGFSDWFAPGCSGCTVEP